MNISFHVRLTAAALSTAFLCLSPMTASASMTRQSEETTSHAVGHVRLAQSGSMGGTIGNREKSLSGSREAAPEHTSRPEHTARPSKPKASRRPAAASESGGRGGGSFDGTWSLSSAGINCTDTFRETATVSGRTMTGAYGRATIGANGSISGSGNYNGIGVTSRGRLSGRSGSGTFQRSDGCHGRWTATKQ